MKKIIIIGFYLVPGIAGAVCTQNSVSEAVAQRTAITQAAAAGRATIIDVKYAQLNLLRAQEECGLYPTPYFCLQRRGVFTDLVRILERRVDLGVESQADLEAARSAYLANENACR